MHATHNPLISIAWDAILEVLPGLPDAVENSKLPGLLEEYQMHQQLFAAVRESDEIRASEILNQCWEKWPFPLHENE